jgi:SsrA-binding protein
VKVLAANRRARFEYEFLERLTSGIALTGSEVKSVRAGHVKLQDGWVAFEAGEAFLADVHIAPYENAGYANHDPIRRRKLLMHSRDIARFAAKVIEKGLTVIPIAVGLEGNWIKVELALAKGKTLYDKRETLRQRTMDREAEAAMKEHR